MACFTQKSLDVLVNSMLAACKKSLEQKEHSESLSRKANQFTRLETDTILVTKIAADIGEKWFKQMKNNAELKRVMRLLCYYQIPYPKATTFNILCSGLLLCCDLVSQKLKSKALSKVLAKDSSYKRFAFDLAVSLQPALLKLQLKSNVMCIRPKFYKSQENHGTNTLEYQFQQITQQYMPVLRKSFLSMGFLPTLSEELVTIPPRPQGIDGEFWDLKWEYFVQPNEKATLNAQTLFNYSVEGGMNEHEAEAMLDAVLVAEDILNIGENWFNFSANKKCRHKKLISTDLEIQKKVQVMISEMFDLPTLDDEHKTQSTGRAKDFFEKVFGKTILENIHREFTQGDAVQLRLFSAKRFDR